ncbi:hypothetical protein DUI70_0846 [Streptomyces albus]|nr:hypothetical protein DUI70_0846 [Streptomyces albus]
MNWSTPIVHTSTRPEPPELRQAAASLPARYAGKPPHRGPIRREPPRPVRRRAANTRRPEPAPGTPTAARIGHIGVRDTVPGRPDRRRAERSTVDPSRTP